MNFYEYDEVKSLVKFFVNFPLQFYNVLFLNSLLECKRRWNSFGLFCEWIGFFFQYEDYDYGHTGDPNLDREYEKQHSSVAYVPEQVR